MPDSNNKISENILNLNMQEVLGSIKIGIAVLSADYSINIMNVGLMNIFAYNQDALLNRSINILFNPDEFKTLQHYMQNSNYTNYVSSKEKIELNGLRHDKAIIPLEITIFKIDANQNPMHILIIRDITEFKDTVEDLQYQATYDHLTKIPNRTLFRDRGKTAIRIAKREDEKLAIIYIDIDEFKTINDTLGHEAGDILLKEISLRFQQCVRDSDTVSRVGGDEFTILMLKITCQNDAAIVAERILETNLLPVKINEQNILPKTSLGISIFPKDGENLDILLKNADMAMYFAKKNGKNQFVFYESYMSNETN